MEKFYTKSHFFVKMVFANISRTVRARAKILAEINPLGHKHTPAHLFPEKIVIISQFCHGSQIWSFLMKKDSKHVGFCHKKIDQIHFDYFICFVKYLSHIGCKHLRTANLYFWQVFHTGCSTKFQISWICNTVIWPCSTRHYVL